MKNSELTAAIEKVNSDMNAALNVVLHSLMETRVKPFCDKYQTRFLSGMGGFTFGRFRDEHDAKRNPEWQELHAALSECSPLINDFCIGSCLWDYTPPVVRD